METMKMWLTNAKIWDGVSDALLVANAIEIVDGRIVQLAASSNASGEMQDCAGLTLIPGLIDAHVHMCLDPDVKDPLSHAKFTDDEIKAKIASRAYEMLLAGITTARDLGGGKWLELEVRDQINRGEIKGTRLFCSGQPVTSVNGHCHFWGGEADNLQSAFEVIDRQVSHDVDLIKIMATGGSLTPGSTPADSQWDAEEMMSMVKLAKSKGYTVAAHCHGTNGIHNSAAAGVTTIEHCSWVGEKGWAREYDPTVVDTIVENGVWVSPTINAGWKRYIGSKSFAGLISGNYQKMRAAGVKLIASTDAGIPGVYHHDLPKAIPVFAHFAGLSPVEALKSATSEQAIGLGHEVGQLSPGYSADLVAYERNPLEDLDVLSTPAFVMSKGIRANV
jgi:imidazolonepropionase-like amidohydrolase